MRNLFLVRCAGHRGVWRLLALAFMFQLTARADQVIYDDALQNGWQDWGWATINYNNTSPVHSGSRSISVTITTNTSQGIYIAHPAFDSSAYTNLVFWINGGAAGGQQLKVQGHANNSAQAFTNLPALVANTWQQFTIPLAALGVANRPNMDGFWIQDRVGSVQPVFYVDDITLQAGAPIQPSTNANVTVQIDALASRHAINPLIYGVAFATNATLLRDLNAPLHRSGGNAETRYNWQLNATSHAADWYFESIADGNTVGGDGDDFIQESKSGGAQAMLTIPIIGWVANLGPGRASLASFSTNKYGPQAATDPWWPAAGNGVSTNGLDITTNDPADANMTADTNFQAGWVQHLTNHWGTATNGGLLYYLMDNEWSLWDSTHRDVHPVGATMDEVFTDFCNYATMVKGIDANALVAGPEEWGWPGYLYSGYDQQWSGAHNDYTPSHYPDRAAHGGQDFGPWFLSQVQQRSQATGRRLLDIFTLHCYPQEGNVGGDAVDAATEELRNQSTRQFWDTNYVDPSWINSIIALIPRMKSWVATNYPGTKIGITEYNWGAESYINGATAQADILGIFGREGVDLATRWTCPGTNTPVYNSFKMYRNYDGNKSTFGDTSILTTVPNPDNLSAFAAVRSSDGAMTFMVINKDLNNAAPITANITNFNAGGTAQRWQLTSANTITHLADIALTNGILGDLLPAQSITLFVLPATNTFNLQIGNNGPPGQLGIWLNGQAGQTYMLASSSDLVHWSVVNTNLLASNSFEFFMPMTNATQMFYRGQLSSP
jgi:hypothetical protein